MVYVCTYTAHILSSAEPSIISRVFSQTWKKNRKSIIYTHHRSNLVLTTSGTSCSGSTKSHSNSPSHTDTEPDGSRNSRTGPRVHVVQQDCWRPAKTKVKFWVIYIVLCCSSMRRNCIFRGLVQSYTSECGICGGQSVIPLFVCTNSLICHWRHVTLTTDGDV